MIQKNPLLTLINLRLREYADLLEAATGNDARGKVEEPIYSTGMMGPPHLALHIKEMH